MGYTTEEQVIEALIGNKVIAATEDTLVLSNGIQLKFDKEANDCCTWIELDKLNTTENIITSAEFKDTDEGEGAYQAWIHVLTEAGELNIAEANADAGNGYYLHGFALGIEIIDARPEPASHEETMEAIASILGT